MSSHDVALLLLDLAVIIVAAKLLGFVARRFGQPPVIGEILAGILLGPTLFGSATTDALFPMSLRPVLAGVANVALVMFMFMVGYELNKAMFRGRGKVAPAVSIGSIVLPMALGCGLALWLAPRHSVVNVLPFVLFVGAAMSVTAFPVLARILNDRGLHRTRIGGITLASAAIDDVLAWTLLAVVVAIVGQAGSADTWRIWLVPAFVLAMFLVVRPALARLTALYERRGRLTPGLLATIIVGLLLSSFATEWMGLHFIFGAFLFGVVMPREGAEALRHEVLQRLEQFSVLLLPVFFVVAGLNVNLSTVGLSGAAELGLILAAAIGGKFLGAFTGARLTGIRTREAGVLATLMNTRGLTEIVILTVGLQLGVLDKPLFSLMVVMALVTTAMAGPLLQLIYPQALVDQEIADGEQAQASRPEEQPAPIG